jgi:galacturan 1,4-alpha-galacturonidase
MKVSTLFSVVASVVGVAALSVELPPGVPRNIQEFREKHPFQKRGKDCSRKTFTIRASKDDLDDISDDFLKGLHDANHGGTLYLPKGKKFIIGKPLDLTFLDDIHVHWEGEVKVWEIKWHSLLGLQD